MALRSMRGFDFVFCRNVLIYFDEVSRKAVVDHFYNALNPGGFVFLGHAEVDRTRLDGVQAEAI